MHPVLSSLLTVLFFLIPLSFAWAFVFSLAHPKIEFYPNHDHVFLPSRSTLDAVLSSDSVSKDDALNIQRLYFDLCLLHDRMDITPYENFRTPVVYSFCIFSFSSMLYLFSQLISLSGVLLFISLVVFIVLFYFLVFWEVKLFRCKTDLLSPVIEDSYQNVKYELDKIDSLPLPSSSSPYDFYLYWRSVYFAFQFLETPRASAIEKCDIAKHYGALFIILLSVFILWIPSFS